MKQRPTEKQLRHVKNWLQCLLSTLPFSLHLPYSLICQHLAKQARCTLSRPRKTKYQSSSSFLDPQIDY